MGAQPRDIETTRTLAAVLVPLFRDARGDLRVLLVQRGMRGLHAGQIGFPGGKHEPDDRSMLETALRETEEEVGLEREQIVILSSLEPLDTRTTSFRVHPFLARITPPSSWRLDGREIVGVLAPSMRELADPGARAERELSFPTWPGTLRVPSILVDDGQVIWGLTLRVLDAILPRVLSGEWAV